MKRSKRKRVLALTLVLTLGLTACGNNSGDETEDPAAEEITDFVDWYLQSSEMETFLPLSSETSADLRVLANAYSMLVELDNHSQIQPAMATEWGSDDDGLTWTFQIREGVYWVDVNGNEKDECTAQDWVTSMEWVLNYWKNNARNTSMLLPTIAGAQEYYEYTRSLSEEEAKALSATDEAFTSRVGVEAPDKYTLVYHCRQNCPYFVTLATSACLFPLAQGQVDELGVDGTYGQSNETMWYNGPYTITEFISGNTKTLTRNPHYWDTDAKLFNTVTVKMVDDGNTDDNLFMSGEVDRCDLSEARLRTIYEDENNEWHDCLVVPRAPTQNRAIQFNYQKLNEDGTPDDNWNTAVANEAFRLSLYYGMELTDYWSRTNFITPEQNEALCFTTHNVVSFSDGTDYADRVIELLGLTGGGRYDAELAEQYKQQAIEELTAAGVTFPVQIDYYVPANNQDEIDKGTVLKQTIEALGTDYVTVELKSYVNSASQEVYNPQLHSFGIAGWYADYGDPENFISQFMYNYDGAYFASQITKENEATDPGVIAQFQEYTALCEVANAIYDDMDARYEAQAQAEAYLISHALIIPCYSLSNWSLTKVNTYSQPFGSYGVSSYIYKNYETKQTAYTAEEYEQLLADYNAEA